MRFLAILFLVALALLLVTWSVKGECPDVGDRLVVENTDCSLFWDSNVTAELWCPNEQGLWSVTLLKVDCYNETMKIGIGMERIAICFEENGGVWACYKPTQRIATLKTYEGWRW